MSDTDQTGAYDPDAPETLGNRATSVAPLQRIGRYRIEKILGEGGFGIVYLAYDEQLQRLVAIKVPHAKLIVCGDDAELYLHEARLVASLDHPHIVPVYDVGSAERVPCFIVSKFIEGCTLATRIKNDRPTPYKSADLAASIAEALHYAHHRGLVHRDVKPGNILIDKSGTPFVVDFGLALKEEDVGTGPRYAGTASYMSPEQARGEGHRVDGRSDVFSLGVVLYEMLTGRRPFKADSKNEPPEQVTDFEPRPPRQYDDRIPKELERICFKAMAKRAADRYSTAKDMADDLRHFLAQADVSQLSTVVGKSLPTSAPGSAAPASSTSAVASAASQGSIGSGPPLKIIPKGLRSFDAHDADFFLELLPGPRDRDGLPDTIRFWKTHIEEKDADNTFSVGLIYGPSGCGKSSLVKAGLLPRLAERVIVVYVEATAEETEARLLHGLRKRCPDLPADLDLKQTLTLLRRGRGMPVGGKVLIVLDQFEQWLHAKREEHNTELVQALRQCNGGRVQCVIMVRDDFWMGATRFLRELEVRLVEGQNSAAVDLFPLRHAEKVLAAFGQAFGVLPENLRERRDDEKQFLQQAVQGLAQEGKVVCVRLALFAEMMKSRPWTRASLREVGGAQGVGATFLEETFSAATAPPLHRYHQQAARAVLNALLPETGSDIKGRMRSYVDLLEASGYAGRPGEFEELMRILDSELRLITPADTVGKDENGRMKDEPAKAADSSLNPPPSSCRSYQLTHDYLVPSLREWLTRKQKETRRGRAELLLADRAAVWNARPENRQLPSLWQWAGIQLLTQRKDWTDPQRKMMRQATRYHVTRGAAILVVLVLLVWGGYEGRGQLQARTLRDRLLDAQTSEVPNIIKEMPPYRRWLTPLLHAARAEAEANADEHKRLHVCLALHSLDAHQGDYLTERLLAADAHQFPVICEALCDCQEELTELLWRKCQDPPAPGRDQRFHAACALARYDPHNPRWEKVAASVAARLVAQSPLAIALWTDALEPVAPFLMPPLADFLEDEKRSAAERGLIAKVYGNYALKLPDGVRRLEKRLTEQPEPKANDEMRVALIKKQANCAAALLVMDRGDKVWPLLCHDPDPTLRCYLMERLAATGVDPRLLLARLERETDVSVQRAILLSLGDYGITRLPHAERQTLLPRLEQIFRDHPDPGVHGAADWLLRQWQADERIKTLEGELMRTKFDGKRKWYVNRQRLTMTVIDKPGDVWVREGADKHQRKLERRYAIAAKEVTLAQFQTFHPAFVPDKKSTHTPTLPVWNVSWYEAAQYCNFLSAKDGLPREQWVYIPNKEGLYFEGMTLAPNWWDRDGYRLPTEAEWVHACRAGADTTFSFGHSAELVNHYVWNAGNSMGRSHPVGMKKPNDFGLFDMHGNVWEWTQDLIVLSDKNVLLGVKKPRDDIDHERNVTHKDYRLELGGSFGNQSIDVRPTFPSWNKTFQRHPALGFRPARTIR